MPISRIALLQAANALDMTLPATKASAQEDEKVCAGLPAASQAVMLPQALERANEAGSERCGKASDTDCMMKGGMS